MLLQNRVRSLATYNLETDSRTAALLPYLTTRTDKLVTGMSPPGEPLTEAFPHPPEERRNQTSGAGHHLCVGKAGRPAGPWDELLTRPEHKQSPCAVPPVLSQPQVKR